MASNNHRRSRRVIALAATTALLSPRVRRLARKSLAAALTRATRAGYIVARGTRNLQEASKHVTRFDANDPKKPS